MQYHKYWMEFQAFLAKVWSIDKANLSASS